MNGKVPLTAAVGVMLVRTVGFVPVGFQLTLLPWATVCELLIRVSDLKNKSLQVQKLLFGPSS